MTNEQSKKSDVILPGQICKDISLSTFTSWRVGGKVKQFYHPTSRADLSSFLSILPPEEPIIFLGLGSNLLVRDGGLDATVIATQGYLSQLELRSDTQVYAEAGVSCAQVARFSARQHLAGIEFLAGIPGTVGGALAMNAGCFGHETWEFVESVDIIDRYGHIRQCSPAVFEIRYREVTRPLDVWFVSATFKLTSGNKENSLTTIRNMLDRRAQTQPTNEPSCGSVFRNPPGHYAAQLIESCGLKGYQLGGAQVSVKHANFIVNTGRATAKDIETLINHVAQEVERVHGIQLVKEVHIVGREET